MVSPRQAFDEVGELSYLARIFFSVYELPLNHDADTALSSQRSVPTLDRFAVRIKFSSCASELVARSPLACFHLLPYKHSSLRSGAELRIVCDMIPLEQLHTFLDQVVEAAMPMFETLTSIVPRPVKVALNPSQRTHASENDSARDEEEASTLQRGNADAVADMSESAVTPVRAAGGSCNAAASASSRIAAAQAYESSLPSSPKVRHDCGASNRELPTDTTDRQTVGVPTNTSVSTPPLLNRCAIGSRQTLATE